MAGGLIQSHDGQIFVLTARRFNWVAVCVRVGEFFASPDKRYEVVPSR